MIGAWEFWTRLEIVGWDPLQVREFFSHSCLAGGHSLHLLCRTNTVLTHLAGTNRYINIHVHKLPTRMRMRSNWMPAICMFLRGSVREQVSRWRGRLTMSDVGYTALLPAKLTMRRITPDSVYMNADSMRIRLSSDHRTRLLTVVPPEASEK